MSPVVYENLLFSAVTVQAGGQDKIPKVRQETHRLLFGLLKGSRVSVKCQSGVTVSREFLYDLSGGLAVRKERNVTVSQAVKTYRVSVSVCQFNSRYPQIFPDKLCRVDRLAKGLKDPVISIRPCMGFQ